MTGLFKKPTIWIGYINKLFREEIKLKYGRGVIKVYAR